MPQGGRYEIAIGTESPFTVGGDVHSTIGFVEDKWGPICWQGGDDWTFAGQIVETAQAVTVRDRVVDSLPKEARDVALVLREGIKKAAKDDQDAIVFALGEVAQRYANLIRAYDPWTRDDFMAAVSTYARGKRVQ